MTIRFIKSWNGYYEGQIVTNPAGRSEADLVTMKYAVEDLDGPDNSPLPVMGATNPLTGGIEFTAGGEVVELGGVTIAEVNAAIASASGVSSVTWVELNSLSGMVVGDSRWVSDVGGGSTWQYNGTRWRPVGGQLVLGQIYAGTPKSDANTTMGTLGSILVNGGLIGPGDSLEFEARVSRSAGSTSVSIKALYGATNIHELSANQTSHILSGTLTAQGVTNSQLCTGFNASYGSVGNGFTVSSEDSTMDKDLSVTGQWSSAGVGTNSLILRSLWVRLLRA